MNNGAPTFITYFDFREALPHPIPRRQLLRLSSVGRFPEFVRPGGLQSEPLFLEDDVKQWFRDKYGKLLPDYVAKIEHEGFSVKHSFHGKPV